MKLLLDTHIWLWLLQSPQKIGPQTSKALADPASDDPRAKAMRRFHEVVAAEPRVSATTIQTVGSKGYDGFTLALVTGDAP